MYKYDYQKEVFALGNLYSLEHYHRFSGLIKLNIYRSNIHSEKGVKKNYCPLKLNNLLMVWLIWS